MNRNHASVGPIDPEKHRENGDVVTAYVLDHPEKPMSPTDRTDDPVRCEWASGGNADFGLRGSFRRGYLQT